MERMVGTITPKKVLRLRGSWLGVAGLDSWGGSGVVPHFAAATVSLHTPEVIRGVCSFDMAAERSCRFACLPCEKENRKGRDFRTSGLNMQQRGVQGLNLFSSVPSFSVNQITFHYSGLQAHIHLEFNLTGPAAPSKLFFHHKIYCSIAFLYNARS